MLLGLLCGGHAFTSVQGSLLLFIFKFFCLLVFVFPWNCHTEGLWKIKSLGHGQIIEELQVKVFHVWLRGKAGYCAGEHIVLVVCT